MSCARSCMSSIDRVLAGWHRIIGAGAPYMGAMLERSDEFAAIDDDLAAHDGRHRPTCDLEPFIWRVVGAMVQISRGDLQRLLGIPDRDIRVRPYRDRTFARMKPIHFGMIGCAEGYELVERDPAFHDALRKQDGQPRLDAWYAVRYPAEAGTALRHQFAGGIVVSERTMVR